MGTLFISFYDFFAKRRGLLFTLAALAFVITAYLASRLHLEEDIAKALPANAQTARFGEALQHSRFLEKIIVMVSQADTSAAPDPDRLIETCETFVAMADSALKPYIASIQYKADDDAALQLLDFQVEYLPVFLDTADYGAIDRLIAPGQIRQTLEDNLHTLSSPAGLMMKRVIARDPVGITWLGMRKYQDFQYDENYELYDGYIMTRDRRHLVLFIQPAYPTTETINNEKLVEGLRILAVSRRLADGVTFFGATAVAVGNAVQLRADTALTLSITVVLLLALLWWFFRRKRVPVLMMLPVLFGVLFALAGIYLWQGSISIIAVGTGSVVLGIALNYAIHFFTHLRYHPDPREAVRELANPMTLGSATTVGAFLCLQFVNSPILHDLGLFAALSLVGAALFTLVVLPHVNPTPGPSPEGEGGRRAYRDVTSPLPFRGGAGGGVAAILLLTPVLFHFAKQVRFDSDMNRLNYMTPDLKAAQDKVNRLNAMALQSVYVVAEGGTLEEALRANEQLIPTLDGLKKAGLVRKYSGVSTFLMSDSLQRARIRHWENYWTPDKKRQLLETLTREGQALKYKASAFDGFRDLLDKQFEPTTPEAVERFKQQFLADYITERPGKVSVVTMLKSGPEHRNAVYDRLSDDRYLILDKQFLTRQFVGLVQEDFNNIALYSSLLVFLALLLAHGRIELAVITFLPMLFSWIWILGLMALLGLEFNIVNVILSALIFGLGDDFAIFVMDGLQQKYKTGQKTLPVIRTSIFISAAATIIGLGVLIFAKHPAVQSLALVSIVGIFCVVLMSQTLEPFLFNWLIQNRVDKQRPPWTLFKIAKSAFAFAYFIFGSLLLTMLGFLFVRWLPVGKCRVKYAYHWTLSKFTGSLIYIMANVKKKIINPAGEDFSKPAVIICNHQSVLDILSTTMLHPKLLLLTNKWVWESPVFGQVVRMADYYPVGEGVDNVERLRDRVAEGYSIVVFPEGTRSPDGAIKRFHKGAFFLAEQFNLDILPLVIHGTGYAMTKGDFMLKDGQITLKFLPRITPDDTRYGANYTERAKLVGRYFRQEYAALQAEIETPAYHREKLLGNYLYKGPVLEWYARIKTALENNYVLFDNLLPKKGKILDIGCGYGFMDYMLHFRAPERDITGMDYDEEKVTVARHCYSKTENIRFEHGDILHYPIGPHDAFVLADVLHYLQPEEQTQVLHRCLENLNPGGVVVIRDGNKDLETRQKGTWWTEFFSTRLLKFNKTSEKGLSFLSAKTVEAVAAAYGLKCEVIDPSKYTSNVIFVIHKPF